MITWNDSLLFFAGFLFAVAVFDVALAWRIYRQFPNQPHKWSGIWMAWRAIALLKALHVRLSHINAAASMFPLTSGHSKMTVEFVEVVRRSSRLSSSSAPIVKIEHRQADGGEEEVKVS